MIFIIAFVFTFIFRLRYTCAYEMLFYEKFPLLFTFPLVLTTGLWRVLLSILNDLNEVLGEGDAEQAETLKKRGINTGKKRRKFKWKANAENLRIDRESCCTH